MQLLNSTYTHQSNLANYCRNGRLEKIPGVVSKNVTQYRRLVIGIVDDMLQNAYPLTHELLSLREWENTVHEFFATHSCKSPQVWYMPKEFYEFLLQTKHPLLNKYPFLSELLWFEWSELELFMMADIPTEFTNSGYILFSRLIINPENRLFSFLFPVHNKQAKLITSKDKSNYYVIAHRNNEGNIIFTDLSPALVRMLEYLQESPLSIKEMYSKFEDEFKVILSENDQYQIIKFFEIAHKQNLIIGFKK